MRSLGLGLLAIAMVGCAAPSPLAGPRLAFDAVGSAQVASGAEVALLAAKGSIEGSDGRAEGAAEQAIAAAKKAVGGKLSAELERAIRAAIAEALEKKGACQGPVQVHVHIHLHGRVDAGVVDGGAGPSAAPSSAPTANPGPSAPPSAAPSAVASLAPSAQPTEHPDGPYLTGIALGPQGELLRFELDPGQEALPQGVGRTGGRMVLERQGQRQVLDDLVGQVSGGVWDGDRLLVASQAEAGQAQMKRYVGPSFYNEVFELDPGFGEPGAPWGAIALVRGTPHLAVGAPREAGSVPWSWVDPYRQARLGQPSQDANARPFDATHDPDRQALVWSSVGGLRQLKADGTVLSLNAQPCFGLAHAPGHGLLSTDYGLANGPELTLTAPNGSRRTVWSATRGFPCRVAVGASGEVAVLVDPEPGMPGARLAGNRGATVQRLRWVGQGDEATLSPVP